MCKSWESIRSSTPYTREGTPSDHLRAQWICSGLIATKIISNWRMRFLKICQSAPCQGHDGVTQSSGGKSDPPVTGMGPVRWIYTCCNGTQRVWLWPWSLPYPKEGLTRNFQTSGLRKLESETASQTKVNVAQPVWRLCDIPRGTGKTQVRCSGLASPTMLIS